MRRKLNLRPRRQLGRSRSRCLPAWRAPLTSSTNCIRHAPHAAPALLCATRNCMRRLSPRNAPSIYRDAFDAVSMVTMQFNVSVAYHDLGDAAAAAAALRTTLDLDREYGFADDAEDNYRLLLQWNNEDAGPEQVAVRMKDFPERSATLSFGWFDSNATLALQSDVSQLAGADFVHFQDSRTARRQVRMHWWGWLASYQLDEPHFKFDELPAES